MGTEENKALVRHYIEEVSRGNLDILDAVISDDYVTRGYQRPAGLSALASYKGNNAAFLAAFPDRTITVHDVIAEGDLVACHITWEGTHTGEYRHLGLDPVIPPTGRRVRFTATAFRRVRDGKLVEGWGTYDHAGMFQQLGVPPPTPPAVATQPA